MDLVVLAYIHIYENNKYNKPIEVNLPLELIFLQRMMLLGQIATDEKYFSIENQKDVVEKDGEINPALGMLDIFLNNNTLTKLLNIYSKIVKYKNFLFIYREKQNGYSMTYQHLYLEHCYMTE